MKTRFLKSAGVAIGLLAMWRGAEAAPLDTRIPQDAIVYAGWAGADALAPAYANSNLKGIVESSKVGDYIRANWEGWMEKAQEANPAAKEIEAHAVKTTRMLWQHPTAMYVGPVGMANVNKPTFKLGFLCDAGAEAPALFQFYKDMFAKHPADPEAKMQFVLDGTVLIMTFGEAKPDDFKVNAAGLPTAAGYKGSVGKMRKDPAVAVYVDAEKIVATIEEGVQKAPNTPAEEKKAVPAVLQALGLKNLTTVAMASGFEGKEWGDEALIGTKGPKVGLLSLLEGPAISDGTIGMVPKEVGSFAAARFDFVKVMGVTRDVLGKIDPKALAEFEKMLGQAGKELGLDIEKELINALGDEWLTYRGPMQDDGSYPYVLVQKLRDATGFGKVLSVVTEKINAAADGKVKIEKLDAGKFEVTGVRLPAMMAGAPTSVAWTIRDGIFYISTLEGVGAAVEHVEGKGASIAANDGFKQVVAALPQVKATSVSFSDPAKLYPSFYRNVMGLLPLARFAGLELPGDLLPMPKKVSGFMTPSGTLSWTDGDGFHFVSRSAFPGAEILSGQASPAAVVGVTAMGTAVLLPSLGKSRELANRSYDAACIRGICQSAIIWSAENNDKMPDHVGRLLLADQISAKQLVSKRSGTTVLVVTDEMREKAKTDFDAFAKEVDAHCDFVYLGKGTTNTTDSSQVLVYEKGGPHAHQGINIGYADCHTEWTRWSNVAEAFKSTNEYLKKNGLPEVNVDLIMKGNPDGPPVPASGHP